MMGRARLTDFGGLLYSDQRVFTSASLTTARDFGDGGYFASTPALYILKTATDYNTSDSSILGGEWTSDESGDTNGKLLGVVNYAANVQALGHWWTSQPIPKSKPDCGRFRDGTSNTVVFAERYKICPNYSGRVAWLGTYGGVPMDPFFATNDLTSGLPIISPPQDAPPVDSCNQFTTQSAHPSGMNVLLADGSVRVVSPSISTATWTNAILPDDGKLLGNDW